MAAFPFGVFREVLRGLNRIHLANICEIIGIIGRGWYLSRFTFRGQPCRAGCGWCRRESLALSALWR